MLAEDEKMIREKFCLKISKSDRANWKKGYFQDLVKQTVVNMFYLLEINHFEVSKYYPFNPYNAEIFLYKLWRPKCVFFNLKSS